MEDMNTKNQRLKDKLDLIVKITLIIIIIILFVYNCKLRDNDEHKPTENGNVDIIEIKCDTGKCDHTIPIEFTDISFFQKSFNIEIGDTFTLVPVIKPVSSLTTKLTWKSSNPDVATVDENGVVKGLKEGIVTITVVTPNGISATCVVRVVKEKVKVNRIVLDSHDISLLVGDAHQILVTVEPENATENELIFESSNLSVATVNNKGIVEGIKPGVAMITVRTKDGKVKEICNVIVEERPIDNRLNVFDSDKDSISWNGSKYLKIFTNSIYGVEGTIAPESENKYHFVIGNSTNYKVKYSIKFIENNDYNINMKYKLKKNDKYVISNYSNVNALTITDYVLNPGENADYYLDWKWVSSSNDTSIGKNPDAKYGLKIEVEAESTNE